jgi:hypothetical protein
METEASFIDDDVRPYLSHQVALLDHLRCAANENDQNVQGPATNSERHAVSFYPPLSREQSKLTEGYRIIVSDAARPFRRGLDIQRECSSDTSRHSLEACIRSMNVIAFALTASILNHSNIRSAAINGLIQTDLHRSGFAGRHFV